MTNNNQWNSDSWNAGNGFGSQPQTQAPAQGFNGPSQGFNAPAQGGSSIWDNFENVDSPAQRNGYVPAGINSAVKIIELKVIQSVKNNNRPVFVATVEIMDETRARYDWVAKADERPYLQNIKALVCAINPEGDPRSFGRELMDALTGPEQPAAGKTVHLRSEEIMTRNGNPFTKCHWSPARS
jgi:hypothetical protein